MNDAGQGENKFWYLVVAWISGLFTLFMGLLGAGIVEIIISIGTPLPGWERFLALLTGGLIFGGPALAIFLANFVGYSFQKRKTTPAGVKRLLPWLPKLLLVLVIGLIAQTGATIYKMRMENEARAANEAMHGASPGPIVNH